MTGLILLILLLIILVVLIYNRTGEHQKSLDQLNRTINSLNDKIESLSRSDVSSIKETPAAVQKTEIIPKPAPEVAPRFKREEIITPLPKQIPVWQKEEEQTIPAPPVIVKKKEQKDLEKFIGENLINKIGIAVLVLGISFFVKYAIDKNWINEVGRVLIGLLCGSILIGIAHYITKSYRSFSSVLIGGGLTVFYFSIAFAFHQYQLIGQTPSFIAMVIITVFAVLLSVAYDRKELAILAAIGGFVTPFLVSSGKENYIALFTYLCILNTGMMALSWFKRWHAINIISLFFTTFIYGGWLVRALIFQDEQKFPYRDALLFATLFYFIFIAMSILNNLRTGRKFSGFDFMIVLGTNFLYFTSGMLALEMWNNGMYSGTFSALLGLFNLALALVFYKKKSIDKNFVSLLLGLAITFISLAAPIQLKGHLVTMFWAAESVLLIWIYNKTRINQLKTASIVMLGLILISILITWADNYVGGIDIIPVIFNRPFVTSLAVVVALFIYQRLVRGEEKAFGQIKLNELKRIVLFIFFCVAYLTGAFEIGYQFLTRYSATNVYTIFLQLYTFAFAIVTLWLYRKSEKYTLLKFVLTILCLLMYVTNIGLNDDISFYLLNNGPAILFAGHWMAAGLLGWLLYDMLHYFFKRKSESWSEYLPHITWIGTIALILLLSVELYQLMLWTSYTNAADWSWWDNLYHKAGLSIIWGVCSFVMMWVGMKLKFRTLRIISLTLFTITIVKLFFYDIRKIPPGGKIAAFILLGVLLLTVSFMYQRLKKIIIENSTE